MEIKANLKNLRMSAQKTRLVADVVRKLNVLDALDQLKFADKLAAKPLATLINSAIANAENTYGLKKDNLKIKELKVDEGFTLKRWMPRAHGRATSIRKRGCNITLKLEEIKASGKIEKKVVKVEEPVKLDKIIKESEKTAGDKKDADNKIKAASGEKARMFRRKAG